MLCRNLLTFACLLLPGTAFVFAELLRHPEHRTSTFYHTFAFMLHPGTTFVFDELLGHPELRARMPANGYPCCPSPPLPTLLPGTTFLFDELLRHPELRAWSPANGSEARWNEAKEPQYWNALHLGSYDEYLDGFARSGWVWSGECAWVWSVNVGCERTAPGQL